jgi:predicted secreted protein
MATAIGAAVFFILWALAFLILSPLARRPAHDRAGTGAGGDAAPPRWGWGRLVLFSTLAAAAAFLVLLAVLEFRIVTIEDIGYAPFSGDAPAGEG